MIGAEVSPAVERAKVRIRRDPKAPARAKSTSTTARAPKKATRRNRSYASPEKMRAAYLAGSGKTSAEIADALGSTTARKVRDLLRSYHISLIRPFDRPKTILINCSTWDLRHLELCAAEVEYEAGDLALAILRAVLAEPVLMRNLIDEAA